MNSWGNEQYGMQNMMNMGTVMPNMMPHMVSPYMVSDMNQMGQMGIQMQQLPPPTLTINQTAPSVTELVDSECNTQSGVIIGPMPEENGGQIGVPDVDSNSQGNEEMQMVVPERPSQSSRDRSDRRDRDRDRDRDRERDRTDRSRRRSRSRNRDRSSRSDRDRNRHEHRERQSKWDNNDKMNISLKPAASMLIQNQPQMMHYGNMMANQMPNSMMSHMDMTNMPQMMQVPGMNMMQNVMMMNPQMQYATQSIYFSAGVMLPPLAGYTPPMKRERPNGCRTIFVGGIPEGATVGVITEIFQRFGAIDKVEMHKGVWHVRFEKPETVEMAFLLSGYRLKGHDQNDNEATTLFIDYALNRDDQNEYEKNKQRRRETTPPRIEPYTQTTLNAMSEKIKNDTEFAEAAPTLAAWLERGECNKKNSNTFYSLIQASNNQLRRLFNEKIQIDEEFQTLKNTMRDKFAHIVLQFEQVAKILTAAKHQRVSDHFSKQQRRNIEMWLKMTEELDNIREEFNTIFEEDDIEKGSKNVVPLEKYEQLRVENENLTYELEGYKNEAHLAKDEAERKFEKFKAHFVAQQALQNKQQVYPPLPSPPIPKVSMSFKIDATNTKPPPPDDSMFPTLPASDAKLISILSAFLIVHPQGVSLDYLVSYVKSIVSNATEAAVYDVLNKYNDVFCRKTSGVGACIEHKWCIVIFDSVKLT